MIQFGKLVAAVTVGATLTVCVSGANAQIGTTSTIRPVAIGISGGVSVPTGDMSDAVNVGYNVAGHILVRGGNSPLQFRADVGYDAFGGKESVCEGTDCNASALSATGNLIIAFPAAATQVRPYLIGGAGLYHMKASATASDQGTSFSASATENDFGFRVGGGINIPLSGLDVFIEAKYTQVQLKDDAGSVKFVPVSVGLMF